MTLIIELTERELLILLMLSEGATVKEMCLELDRASYTIRHLMYAIRVKLGARNNVHAVALAYHKGILVPERMTLDRA